ncbi:MAG: META domain-containing protein [Patescibacteria group bacterium]
MRKIISIVVVVAIILVAGFFYLNNYIYQEKQGPTDYKDATFLIENKSVTLVDGVSEVAQEGSSSKIVTKYFGNQAKGDLNKDGIPDLAFILTQETGGSGTFFYVVGAIQTPNNTYNGTDGVLLGDRVAPQSTEIRSDGILVVNFAVRQPNEPMTASPSVAKSIWLKLDLESLRFGIVEQNFEGEADPAHMTLTMKPWSWVSVLYNDAREIKPNRADVFVLTFGGDGKFTAKTDCNSAGGQYVAKDGTITFSNIFATKMYCEGSQEAEFLKLLENTSSYHFTSRGQLILDLKFDSGSVIFQ